jgi:hypothetical protein
LGAVMLHLVKPGRTYDPDTIAVMAAAFDRVCRSVPPSVKGSDDARRALALAILRNVDQGERDPARLAVLAYGEFSGDSRREKPDRK